MTTKQTNALYEFAQLIEPGDAIEFHVSSDQSASLTAIRDRVRVVTLVVDPHSNDGHVYDLREMHGPGYHVYGEWGVET